MYKSKQLTKMEKTTNFNIGSLSNSDYVFNFSTLSDLEQAIEGYISDCNEHITDMESQIEDWESDIKDYQDQIDEMIDDAFDADVSDLEDTIELLKGNIEETEYSLNRMRDDVEDGENHLIYINQLSSFISGYSLIKNPYTIE